MNFQDLLIAHRRKHSPERAITLRARELRIDPDRLTFEFKEAAIPGTLAPGRVLGDVEGATLRRAMSLLVTVEGPLSRTEAVEMAKAGQAAYAAREGVNADSSHCTKVFVEFADSGWDNKRCQVDGTPFKFPHQGGPAQ